MANFFQDREHLDKINKELYKRNFDLAVRNRTLLLLRKLYEIATSSIQAAELASSFAQALRKDLNLQYVGIYFLNEEFNFLSSVGNSSSSNFAKLSASEKVFFEKVNFEIIKKNAPNLLIKSFREGKVGKTETLKSVFGPAIKASVLQKLQTELNIKTTLVFPLNIEQKKFGVIALCFTRKFQQLSKFERESLQNFVNVIAIGLDKALLYQKLKEANEHLKELDTAKSEFISIASHQLRTPLTGIMGYLSMMVAGDFGKIEPTQLKILTDVYGASNRLIRIVNIFLNVSRIEAGRFYLDYKQVPFDSIIDEIVMELKPTAAKKGITLEVDPSVKAIGQVTVDPDKMKDVALNLVDNAIKYSQSGTISVRAKKEGLNVHCFVHDQGVGIDPEEAKRLFSKFVRGTGIARVQPNGSGLGLFIAKKVVEEHAGKIWVESEGEGKGSTFQFVIPIKATQEQIDLQAKIASKVSKQKAQAAKDITPETSAS